MNRTVLAIILVGGLVGAAVGGGLMARTPTTGDDPAPRPAAETPSPATDPSGESTVNLTDLWQDQSTIRFEAEAPKSVDGPIEFFQDPSASGGKGLTIPEAPDKQELNPQFKTVGGQPVPSKELDKFKGQKLVPNGLAVYEFEVKEEGDYILWARHYWPHSCADSFSFRIDNGPRRDFFGETTERVWTWGRPRKTAKPIHLTAGSHSLVLMNREDGMKVDKFLLTTDDGWVPTGVKGE